MDKFLDWASKVRSESQKIGGAAILVGIVVIFLTGPITVDALTRPDLHLYQIALRTMPLTLAVASIIIALTQKWFAHPFSYILFAAVAVVLSAGIADYIGCVGCVGTGLIRSAYDDVSSWSPEWVSKYVWPLNILIFIVAAVVEYVKLYHPATFIASLICGTFLAASLMHLAKIKPDANSRPAA